MPLPHRRHAIMQAAKPSDSPTSTARLQLRPHCMTSPHAHMHFGSCSPSLAFEPAGRLGEGPEGGQVAQAVPKPSKRRGLRREAGSRGAGGTLSAADDVLIPKPLGGTIVILPDRWLTHRESSHARLSRG